MKESLRGTETDMVEMRDSKKERDRARKRGREREIERETATG